MTRQELVKVNVVPPPLKSAENRKVNKKELKRAVTVLQRKTKREKLNGKHKKHKKPLLTPDLNNKNKVIVTNTRWNPYSSNSVKQLEGLETEEYGVNKDKRVKRKRNAQSTVIPSKKFNNRENGDFYVSNNSQSLPVDSRVIYKESDGIYEKNQENVSIQSLPEDSKIIYEESDDADKESDELDEESDDVKEESHDVDEDIVNEEGGDNDEESGDDVDVNDQERARSTLSPVDSRAMYEENENVYDIKQEDISSQLLPEDSKVIYEESDDVKEESVDVDEDDVDKDSGNEDDADEDSVNEESGENDEESGDDVDEKSGDDVDASDQEDTPSTSLTVDSKANHDDSDNLDISDQEDIPEDSKFIYEESDNVYDKHQKNACSQSFTEEDEEKDNASSSRSSSVDFETGYKCNDCDKRYSSSLKLLEHSKEVHSIILYIEPNPNVPPPIIQDGKYICSECEISFNSKHGYSKHRKAYHSIISATEKINLNNVEKENTIYYDANDHCKICCSEIHTSYYSCTSTYNDKSTYHLHLYKEHGIMNPINPGRSKPNKSIQPDQFDPSHYCCSCEKKWNTSRSYYAHLRKVHQIYSE